MSLLPPPSLPYSPLAGASRPGSSGIDGLLNSMIKFLGFGSVLSSVLPGLGIGPPLSGSSQLSSSLKLFLLGTMIESGRRFWKWILQRFVPRFSITARFPEGDPIHEWIVMFLTEKKVWHRSLEYTVRYRISNRRWGASVDLPSSSTDKTSDEEDGIDYLPSFGAPQIFRWNGYWVEVLRENGTLPPLPGALPGSPPRPAPGALRLKLYTLNQEALKKLIREAKKNYIQSSKKRVIVRSLGTSTGPPPPPGSVIWGSVKVKTYRPLDSIILPKGILEMIVGDARSFITSEDWYTRAGIPYRRGYLFYGPPGTGKSSTVYALAGALGLEIYTLSLSTDKLTDTSLKNAIDRIPKRGILLMEDIDCAFPSREDEEGEATSVSTVLTHVQAPGSIMTPQSKLPKPAAVTMSGLLNVLDGVGSDEGKIFMATTNYIDRLDAALLRPGRLDLKIKYELADRHQIVALFNRFFTPPEEDEDDSSEQEIYGKLTYVAKATQHPLANDFAELIPEREFSIAELQGYLLSCRPDPEAAIERASAWVTTEREVRSARELRESGRKDKLETARRARDILVVQAMATAGTVGLPRATLGSNSTSVTDKTTVATEGAPST